MEKRSRAAACILARSPQASSHWGRYDFQHRAGPLGTCTSFIFIGYAEEHPASAQKAPRGWKEHLAKAR